MIGYKCKSCKRLIPETGGCNIFKAQEKYIKTGKCEEFEINYSPVYKAEACEVMHKTEVNSNVGL